MLQTKIDNEVKISNDLKEHFRNKTTPVEFYKVLEENVILVEDLMMLKSIYLLLKKTEEKNIKLLKEYEEQLNKMLMYNPEEFVEINKVKEENREAYNKLVLQVKSLEKIISQLNGII